MIRLMDKSSTPRKAGHSSVIFCKAHPRSFFMKGMSHEGCFHARKRPVCHAAIGSFCRTQHGGRSWPLCTRISIRGWCNINHTHSEPGSLCAIGNPGCVLRQTTSAPFQHKLRRKKNEVISRRLFRLLRGGAAQIRPLFSQVGPQFFAGDLTRSGALNVWAAFGWDLANIVFPLADKRRRYSDVVSEFYSASRFRKVL